jgi:hypothetical protein
MKALLVFVFAFSMNAFASGKLSFEARMGDQSKSAYVAGLSIYEKMDKGMYYNSWTGFGDAINPDVETFKSWLVTKHQIDFKMGDVVFSPGVRATYMPDWGAFSEETLISEGYLKVSYDLW